MWILYAGSIKRAVLSTQYTVRAKSVYCVGKQIEAETIYEEGTTVGNVRPAAFTMVGDAVAAARARKGISQKELAQATGIDQSDLSKIERGVANPSIGTLNRIAVALDAKLTVSIA